MKFSQFSDDSNQNYFFSQPHQPFFVLAFVNAVVTMFIFLLSYKGVITMDISPLHFHTYGIIFLMLTPAFLAFLFTTFPRFASTTEIEKPVYMRIFGFYYMGAILFLLGSIMSTFLSVLGMLILLIGHTQSVLILKNIYHSAAMDDTHDMYWIFSAMGFGLISHFIFVIGTLFYAPFVGLATEIAIYLYLFLLTFTVAQRMVPFFSHRIIEKNKSLLKTIALLLFLRLLIEGIVSDGTFLVDFGLAYLIGKELLRWKLPFPNKNPLLWILHISLFWIPVAFVLGGLSDILTLVFDINFLGLDMHSLMLGFVFTILIGFGTRVTLGHSGSTMKADSWTMLLFSMTQIVVLLRIFVSFTAAFGWDFIGILDISVIVWILLLTAWAARFFIVLITGKKLT